MMFLYVTKQSMQRIFFNWKKKMFIELKQVLTKNYGWFIMNYPNIRGIN